MVKGIPYQRNVSEHWSKPFSQPPEKQHVFVLWQKQQMIRFLPRSVAHPLLFLLFIYFQHPSFHLLPPCLSSSFISSTSALRYLLLFIFLCHSLHPSDSPSRCQGTAACAYCILSGIFSITVIKQTPQTNRKLQVYSAASWKSSTSGRGWLHLQTSGHNGLVHPAVYRQIKEERG